MTAKVLAVFPSAVDGGAEQLVLDQLRLHDAGACHYTAIALRRGGLDPAFRPFADYHCLDAFLPVDPVALWRLSRLVTSRRIDVLHTHLQEADFYGFLLALIHPRLVWISTRHNTNQFRTRRFWTWLNRRCSRHTTHVLAVSNAVREFVIRHEGVAPERSSVIYNGVDTARFRQAAAGESVRTALGLDPGAFVVGIAGRLTRQKGHRYLLEAVARIAREAPSLHVLIVGQGRLAGHLAGLARRLGIADRVTFAGYRHDMADMYAAMDALCQPSVFEGFGLALVEAMLSGPIVVGSRVDGIREVIDDGVTGLLAAPADSADLARVLLRVYRKEYDPDIVRRAREKALASFDFATNLRLIEALYLRLHAERHQRRQGG